MLVLAIPNAHASVGWIAEVPIGGDNMFAIWGERDRRRILYRQNLACSIACHFPDVDIVVRTDGDEFSIRAESNDGRGSFGNRQTASLTPVVRFQDAYRFRFDDGKIASIRTEYGCGGRRLMF